VASNANAGNNTDDSPEAMGLRDTLVNAVSGLVGARSGQVIPEAEMGVITGALQAATGAGALLPETQRAAMNAVAATLNASNGGIGTDTATAVLGVATNVLGASVKSSEDQAVAAEKTVAIVSQLGTMLLKDTVVGEDVSRVSTPLLALAAGRQTSHDVGSKVSGGNISIAINGFVPNLPSVVDFMATSYTGAANPFLAKNGTEPSSSVVGLTLYPAGSRQPVNVSGSDIRVEVPAAAPAPPGFTYACQYWDVNVNKWSTEGMSVQLADTAAARRGEELTGGYGTASHTTHLTDFATTLVNISDVVYSNASNDPELEPEVTGHTCSAAAPCLGAVSPGASGSMCQAGSSCLNWCDFFKGDRTGVTCECGCSVLAAPCTVAAKCMLSPSTSCSSIEHCTSWCQYHYGDPSGSSCECGCVAPPTPAPTVKVSPVPSPVPNGAGRMTIANSMTFGHLTATGWTFDVKKVYETAYGIVMGLYNDETLAWLPECEVSSLLSSRRAIVITFSASVPQAYAAMARGAADNLQAGQMSLGIARASAALQIPVQVPLDGDISLIQAASSPTPAPDDTIIPIIGDTSNSRLYFVVGGGVFLALLTFLVVCAVCWCCGLCVRSSIEDPTHGTHVEVAMELHPAQVHLGGVGAPPSYPGAPPAAGSLPPGERDYFFPENAGARIQVGQFQGHPAQLSGERVPVAYPLSGARAHAHPIGPSGPQEAGMWAGCQQQPVQGRPASDGKGPSPPDYDSKM